VELSEKCAVVRKKNSRDRTRSSGVARNNKKGGLDRSGLGIGWATCVTEGGPVKTRMRAKMVSNQKKNKRY